jgi:cellulose synthase/poly-beta-1,6-N-acetylglucosamine synthase-like glycosyltransferase
LPGVTVIIAARPGQADVKAVAAARQLDYPADLLEIIVARGTQPSRQRNLAIDKARGELVYFLDDDSIPPSGNLHQASGHFLRDQTVKLVGGPNVCPADASPLQKMFELVLGSWIAFGPSRARYKPLGKNWRPASEKELILCNLIVRRDTLIEHGGFNEGLYPNEENALMDDIQKRGGLAIYDPKFIVWRLPRETPRSFIKMLMTYGRGRAEQFRLNPTALNFAPPLFCVYLLSLIVLEVLPLGNSFSTFKLCAAAPFAVYVAAIILQSVALIPTGGLGRSLAAMPWLVAAHLFYGLGFWRGLFTRLDRGKCNSSTEVTLETIRP